MRCRVPQRAGRWQKIKQNVGETSCNIIRNRHNIPIPRSNIYSRSIIRRSLLPNSSVKTPIAACSEKTPTAWVRSCSCSSARNW